jgi:Leucine-rich repeat (LRR) protein
VRDFFLFYIILNEIVIFFSIYCYNSQLTSTKPDTRIASITGNLEFPNLSNVESISIDGATVTFMPDLTLFAKQFPKFEKLSVIRSGLKYVERKQLAKIPQLRILRLYNNLIEHLPENVFSDLVQLKELWLASNKITVLPPKLLWNLPNLFNFWVERNSIERIPRDFFKNNLEMHELAIYDNKITRIEVDLTLLRKLSVLNLNNNSCISEGWCSYCNTFKLREIQQKINRNCTGKA